MGQSSPVSFADQAAQQAAAVVSNERIARDTYRIRLLCPSIARRIVPGQFVMCRLSGRDDPLLGRPLALYDTLLGPDGQPTGVELVYLVVGRMTKLLAQVRAGEMISLWGPLGNGFAPNPVDHLLMVAGGIGQTPFVALAREALGGRAYGQPPRSGSWARQVTLCYGARSADLLAGVDDFLRLGVEVKLATDDGTTGHHGLVTDLVSAAMEAGTTGTEIVCCGPEPMMERVAALASAAGVPCRVSLETPMACGIGICFSCVAKVREPGGGWDYQRTCVAGPVFAAEEIIW